ncbi:MAG: carbohydrate porin [Chloroflexota bacterium]
MALTSVLSTLLMTNNAYSQDDAAIQFGAGIRTDFIGLNNYDRRKYGLFHGEADISLSATTEDLNLFSGGEFFVQGMGIYGDKASGNYTGDIQTFSNIESENRIFLYQAYYKHSFKKLFIKAGQLDMNADFLVSGYGASLLNSSFGVVPTISLNMPVSIFSYLAAGVSFKYIPTERLLFEMAFFDGDPGDFNTNRHNLNWNFSRKEGIFNISEVQWKTRSNMKPGKYKAGIFFHSNTHYSGVDSTGRDFGFFVFGDQVLTSEKNTIRNGLSMFFELSFCPSKVNFIDRYFAAGLIYRGLLKGMNEDECTLAVSSARLGKSFLMNNTEFLPHETAIELTYKKYITPAIIIQPDFQYLINSGANKSQGNVAAGLIRTIISF